VPLAASPDDLVEAFERPAGSFLAAVQWHPENLVAERKQKALFEAFLEASRARARGSAGGFTHFRDGTFASKRASALVSSHEHPGAPPSAGGTDRPQ
jgi:hypothetical protein